MDCLATWVGYQVRYGLGHYRKNLMFQHKEIRFRSLGSQLILSLSHQWTQKAFHIFIGLRLFLWWNSQFSSIHDESNACLDLYRTSRVSALYKWFFVHWSKEDLFNHYSHSIHENNVGFVYKISFGAVTLNTTFNFNANYTPVFRI